MESRLGRGPRGCARRDSPPSRNGNNNADSSRTPSPKQQHFSTSDALERPGTRVAPSASHSWRPEHRPDAPPFDTQRTVVAHQRASPSTKQLKAAAVPPLSLSPVYAAANDAVQPPRTPQGRASYATFSKERGLTAAERVRMELSAHGGSRAASGSRSNSSEDVFAARSPVYDEKKNGPRSCPSAFNGEEANPTRFSPHRRRQPRNGELIVSKLLPTRDSVNSLLTYLHELQRSEASLRKQLMKTKQHTEEELYQSLSKLTELQRTMHEVERDRRIAQQRLEEKEQRIRELAAKLEKAEATKAKGSPVRSNSSLLEGPSYIAEESTSYREPQPRAMMPDSRSPQQVLNAPVPSAGKIPALTLEALENMAQHPAPPLHPQSQLAVDESTQFGILSPRSPHRPLWDPWASGGATPMKNLPPVFTIGSTGLDPMMNFPPPTEVLATSNSKIASDYELRSVLLSPRRVQDQVQGPNSVTPTQQPTPNMSTINGFGQLEAHSFEPLEQASPFDADATLLSPSYPQQQDRTPPNTPDAAYDAPPRERMSLLELPAPADPLLQIGAMPPIHESPYEHQSPSCTPTERYVGCVDKVEGSSHDQKEMKGSAISQTQVQMPMKSRTPSIQDNSGTADRGPNQGALGDTAVSEPDAISEPQLNVSSPAPPKPTSESVRTVPLVNQDADTKMVSAEPVSLETLLLDFFTEVDKKRLKMAKVYGKRYAGREKFLFTELTKRYGPAKVAALKARFENGSTSGESGSNNSPSINNSSEATNGQTSTKSSEGPAHQKPGRLGHPRHPQFFHPPTPASNVDLSGNMPPVPPPVVPAQENEVSGSQVPATANEVVTPPSPGGKTSPGRGARVSPRQRRSGGNIPPFSGPPPPSFPTAQEANEGAESVGAAVDGPPTTSGPPPPPPSTQREAPAGQFSHPSPPPFGGIDSNVAPTGLRQRHNASGPGAQSQISNATETAAVTLEGLLKDLYKKHQPDKLKNVAIVAKQYAGKERELVGLLKGKYGALSVKHLEENLEALERAHRARIGSKGAGKKRGCFVRTISLVFWLSVLLYFSFGAVFVSFVVVDVWECHGLDNDEQDPESADDCTPLQKELETFTYERVGDYVGQSHPEACFCSEWKVRESALLSNLSGADLVNLARMVPFSPDSFGAPLVASVKEQIPSQEFYDSYAKPVVDVSLDVGSFVWSSLLELAGLDEVVEQSSVVSDVVETMNDTDEVALLDEESELDSLMDSYEAGYEEVKDEGFVAEEESFGEPSDEAEVEAAVVDDASEQMPTEQENDQIQDELQAQDHQVQESDSIVSEDVPDLVDEDVAVFADEEPVLANAVESDEVEVEEYVAVDSSQIDELESEADALMAEVKISVDDSETESADPVNGEVSEVLSEDDGRESNSVEEIESEAADDGVTSASNDDEEVDASVETEELGVADESLESTTVDNDDGAAAGIVSDESSSESEDVVEVEVHQEGLDLSYPETGVEEADEANVESDELPYTDLNEDSEEVQAVFDDDEGVSASSNDEEVEVTQSDIELGAFSVDEPEVEADVVADVSEDDEPNETNVEVAESEAEVPIEMSEVEDVDESTNLVDMETEEGAFDGFTPSEAVDPDIADIGGESSSTIDLETLIELKSESKVEVDTDVIVAEAITGGQEDDNHVEVDTTALAKEEETMPVEDNVGSDNHDDVEAVANSCDDELAMLADSETKTVGLPWEEEVGSRLGKKVVDTPELYEDDREDTVVASVKVDTTAEAQNESSEDVANDAEGLEVEAEPAHSIDVEAERAVSERGLVEDFVEESVMIKVTGVSDEVTASAESVDQADRHEIVDTSDKSAVSLDATEVADDRGSFEAEIRVQAVKRSDSNDESVEEDNEDEEIAFMEELADPDEVLRLAEQAAAAELSFETR